MSFDCQTFQKYVQDEFYQWRGATDKTWTEFAIFIGVSQQTMAAWKNKYLRKRPSYESVEKLAAQLGNGAFVAAGFGVSSTDLTPEDEANLNMVLRDLGINSEALILALKSRGLAIRAINR